RSRPMKQIMEVRVLQAIADRLTNRTDHLRVYSILKNYYRNRDPGDFQAALTHVVKVLRNQHIYKFKPIVSRNSNPTGTCNHRDPTRPPAAIISSNRPVTAQPPRNESTRITISSNK